VNLLALDTSSLSCSVALQIGSEIIERHEEQAREHTRLLIPMISSLLEDTNTVLTDVDAIVLGNGPGSFIGMRIGASVAQGLAFGAGLRIVPVSSLAAVAAQVLAEHDATEVVVAQDAHMHEVYLGLFRRGADNLPVSMAAEYLQKQTPITLLADEPDVPRVAAGFGWQRYPDLFTANRHYFAGVVDVHHPKARYLLPMGEIDLAGGKAIEPGQVMPAYLREKVAEVPKLAARP
jgi:tRNA threonylcarbamoyladenosine biosynthesis protein TsaB